MPCELPLGYEEGLLDGQQRRQGVSDRAWVSTDQEVQSVITPSQIKIKLDMEFGVAHCDGVVNGIGWRIDCFFGRGPYEVEQMHVWVGGAFVARINIRNPGRARGRARQIIAACISAVAYERGVA